MIQLLRLISFVVNIYMMIIIVRVILTWFSWERNSGFLGFISSITDPYINWFRRFPFLKTGYIDFSPIAALGVLSLVNRIFAILASHGSISIGIILAMVLQLVWGIVSFVIGFSIVILILRLVAQYVAHNSQNPFWRLVDGFSQPVLYRVNRLFFKSKIVNFRTGLLVSIACLGVSYFLLRFVFFLATRMLANLPF